MEFQFECLVVKFLKQSRCKKKKRKTLYLKYPVMKVSGS